MKLEMLEQNTKEWLEYRKDKIGASDAPIIAGVSPWKTPYKLWREKLSLDSQAIASWSMERGKELEVKARNHLSQKWEIDLQPKVIQHRKIPYMIASLDGISSDKKIAVEIKCPGSIDHNLAKEGKIPHHYIPQLQHQLETCELEKIIYYSFDGEEGISIDVYRDEAYIKDLLILEKDFWECMQELIPPNLGIRDYVERTDIPWKEAAKEWLMIKSSLKDLEQKEKNAREHLIKLSENMNSKGFGISISKVTRRGNIEYHRIPELKDINFDVYRKPPTEAWRILEI